MTGKSQIEPSDGPRASLDPQEVAKFARAADAWWDTSGEFRPLHVLNPTRVAIIKAAACKHFDRDSASTRPFEGLSLLDIGCGGGLVAEPMTRLGASVTGADASPENIATAANHAERMGLEINYYAGEAADLSNLGNTYDVVLALEIIEHVADSELFAEELAALVAPGGLLIVSTLNRTLKSFALAKFTAEYILRWVPKGTHDASKFVTPLALRQTLAMAGLEPHPPVGMSYNPLKDEWRQSHDISVNYLMTATKPKLVKC